MINRALFAWTRLAAGIMLAGLLTAAACSGGTSTAGDGTEPEPAPALEIREPFARTPGTGDVASVYFTVANAGAADDALLQATTEVAGEAQLHTTVMADGAMKMQQVERIDVPAGAETVLQPGGYHVMLMNLRRPLQVGDVVEVTLHFERSGMKVVQAPVVPYTSTDGGGSGMGQGHATHGGQ